MGKLLEVREFDSIVCNMDYREDENYKYIDRKEFDALVKFLHEFTGNGEQADVLDFMQVGYKRQVGEFIRIKNYVGLIRVNQDFQIQVLPKISFDAGEEDTGNQKTKKIFLKMLRSRKDFPAKVFQEASLKADRMNLYELFINLYLQEVRSLVKRGMRSSYVALENNLLYCRGKLLTGKQIQVNLTHKERFYVAYDEFHINRPENRLVKATLLKLQKRTGSAENAKEIRKLLIPFEEVTASVNYQKDFERVVLDRNAKEYALLMAWSKVFLKNQSFTAFSGDISSEALLFPMEALYESYVAQQLKKVMCPYGWEVRCQDKRHYLFTEPGKRFALRPDIVMERNGRTVVLDTKWKRLVDNDRINYGISQSDMYQMYAYSKKYGTGEIWLLYPVNDEMRGQGEIYFESGDGTCIRLFFVDLAKEDDLERLREEIEKGGKQ